MMSEQVQPENLSDDQLEAVTGGTGVSTGSIGASINMQNIQGMDLEAAMMAVQNQRAQLLETQLKDQMASVKLRNEKISDLNGVLGAFNAAAGKAPSDAKSTYRVTDGDGFVLNANGTRVAGMESITKMFEKSGVTGFDHRDMTKGELDSAISQVKSSIDSQSNSQQMDMLRLQALSNKRNEAFDLMTNFVKKMQDSRSTILSNMR